MASVRPSVCPQGAYTVIAVVVGRVWRPSNVSRRSADADAACAAADADADVSCQPWDACSRTLARPTTAMTMPRRTRRRPSSIRGECTKSVFVYDAREDLDPVSMSLEDLGRGRLRRPTLDR